MLPNSEANPLITEILSWYAATMLPTAETNAYAMDNPTLPEGMEIKQSYDTSVFIDNAIDEVYKTLGIAIVLVVLVIYLFLGNARAMLVPAVTVPVSLVATFLVGYDFGDEIDRLFAHADLVVRF